MEQLLTLQQVDYNNSKHVNDLLSMLQMYASDPMGGGGEIAAEVIEALPKALIKRDFMYSFIVYLEGQAIAFANCIESFSTFSAKGVMNIHDFAVSPNFRGQGVSQFLMAGIQDFAITIACTKLSLEVLEKNNSAIRAYQKAGFEAYQLNPNLGNAMFWQKVIT